VVAHAGAFCHSSFLDCWSRSVSSLSWPFFFFLSCLVFSPRSYHPLTSWATCARYGKDLSLSVSLSLCLFLIDFFSLANVRSAISRFLFASGRLRAFQIRLAPMFVQISPSRIQRGQNVRRTPYLYLRHTRSELELEIKLPLRYATSAKY
jgi:hypothetical protein